MCLPFIVESAASTVGPVSCAHVWQALEEFSSLWLDQFDQLELPVDTTRLMVALTSALKNIPKKTPKREIGSKWKEEVENLFQYREGEDQTGLDQKWHVFPDEILVMTQRLAGIGAKEAEHLVPWLS